MKKITALILAVIMCASLCAYGGGSSKSAWSLQQTVDEFGDVTENSADVIAGTFTGTFSNTATQGSDLTVNVHFGRKAKFNHYIAGFELMEYNSTKATFLSSDSKLFKVKLNDEIITMNLTGTAPNGTLYLGEEDYGWAGDILFNELLKGNDVRCIITIGHSEYNFTLTSGNFTSICEENNCDEGATYLTFKEAVEIFLNDTGEYIEGAQNAIINNFEKFEILDSAAIKSALNKKFLEISVSSYMPVGDFAFPHWYGAEYSFAEGVKKNWVDFSADDDGIQKNINKGYFPHGYETYRCRYPFVKKPSSETKISVDNDLITFKYEKNSFSYQCRKITDDIYLICVQEDNGSFSPARLLFSCESFYDLIEIVEDAKAMFNIIEP